jgi:hypothetical protein
MLRRLKQIYHKIGIHTAAPGTGLYWLHVNSRLAVRRLSPNQKKLRPSKKELRSDKFVIAFRLTGGIGDFLISARYIRDLLATLGDFQFDIYSSRAKTAEWIFSSFPQFRRHYDDCYAVDEVLACYPLAMWLTSFVHLYKHLVDWKVVGNFNPQVEVVCRSIDDFYAKYWLLVDKHPRLDGYLGEIAVLNGLKRMNFLQGISGIRYGGKDLFLQTDQHALQKFDLKEKQYLTIHNGFDQQEADRIGIISSSTKHYPHFEKVIPALRNKFPDMLIVQLGSATSIPINGADRNLLGKTTIEETAEIIKKSRLHADGESGLVHLAACLGITSCVVFGPTSVDYFSYSENINIKPNFCGNCWWMTETWLKECPRGFDSPRCLSEQDPEILVRNISELLKRPLVNSA